MDFYVHQPDNEDVGLVWSKDIARGQFVQGIEGAHLVVPFQCDLCWFRNIKSRDPLSSSLVDERLLHFIRRVNLDLIWAKSPGTYASARTGLNNILKSWKQLGLHPSIPPMGPWPLADNIGFLLALAELRYSQNEGKNRKSHLQFDTVRKLRTAYSHIHESSARAHDSQIVSFRGPRSEVFGTSTCPTQSKFFILFTRGLLLRMGRQTNVNLGLDFRILHCILDILNADFTDASATAEKIREAVMIACFLLFGFVLALRGHEIFMVEAHGMHSHIHLGRDMSPDKLKHVVIPLLGRFKNEDGARYHLMLSSAVTLNSCFNVRVWADRLAAILKREQRQVGPAFCHRNGTSYSSSEMNDHFHTLLERIQLQRPDLIPPELDVRFKYNIYRSLRRGSTARAKNMKVSQASIDLHNRWRSIEMLKGQRPKNSMSDYYTDLSLSLESILEYTQAL